jgi:cobalt/nickel transport system permease protein
MLVVSLPRSSPAILACYAIGPFTILVLARIPLRFVFKHVLLVSPFVLVLALTCPLYDRTPVNFTFGPISGQISLGWMRCVTILAKFVVTMLALIALVSTTRFADLLAGLEKMRVPRLQVVQLGFIYRYIFILIDRIHRMLRARSGRKLRNLGFKTELKVASAMLGSLLTQSIDNAENVNVAMQARGFDGKWRTVSRLKMERRDLVFTVISICFLAGLQLIAIVLFQ